MIDRPLTAILFLSIVGVFALPLDRSIGKYKATQDIGEYGKFYEGDMILNKDQIAALRSRNGLIPEKYRWPNKTVPYQLSTGHTQAQNDHIEAGLKRLAEVSCLKFVKRTNEKSYVQLNAAAGGCYSHVGYQGGAQVINLQSYEPGSGCFRLGTIMHEFLHALGFYHMQSAYDRDEYVTIKWENISEGTEHNFNKYNSSYVTHFNATYDYYSVLHYSAYGFSKNGKPTIVPVNESYTEVIGQRADISEVDIYKLNAMYQCE